MIEIYLVEYPKHLNSYDIRTLKAKLEDYLSDINPYGLRKDTNKYLPFGPEEIGLKFNVIESNVEEITTTLLYPHNAKMPKSFLQNILSNSKSYHEDQFNIIEDRAKGASQLYHRGWNPSFAFNEKYLHIGIRDMHENHYLLCMNETMHKSLNDWQDINNIGKTKEFMYEDYCLWEKEELSKLGNSSYDWSRGVDPIKAKID